MLVATVDALVAIAADHGLRAAMHPHAATNIEFADEIERVMADADSRLRLCLDTAHAVYGGIELSWLFERYGDRIAHVHLKDLRSDRLATAKAQRMAFLDAVDVGVFCPIGDGAVDLPATAALLDEVGYTGWCTFEQDRPLSAVDVALGDARRSLARLRADGF
jgi:inosose dehydratase